jgi:putative tryptophan/tyrosine transport system substrate-binding protein
MVLTLLAARGLAVLVALLLFGAPNPAKAQPAGKLWRIGFLTPAELPWATLIGPLRELGYVDGQTARFEFRSAQNDLDRLPELATDLVRTSIDIIVAVSPPAIIAAKKATPTIPVVMAF